MYLAAPINKVDQPTINISEGKAEIAMAVNEDFFHAANALHGSVYFKMLDDAAFFAAHSVIDDVFILTVSFQTQLLRPINSGKIFAKGELIKNMGNKMEARAKLFNDEGKLIATGSGVFVKSKKMLDEIKSFKI
jgi:uncharacterized protein (TIGR00369 family)